MCELNKITYIYNYALSNAKSIWGFFTSRNVTEKNRNLVTQKYSKALKRFLHARFSKISRIVIHFCSEIC